LALILLTNPLWIVCPPVEHLTSAQAILEPIVNLVHVHGQANRGLTKAAERIDSLNSPVRAR
jgi:hypothetical protein